jgi:hypothetical protein
VLALVDYYVRNSLETHFKSVNTSLIKPLGVTSTLSFAANKIKTLMRCVFLSTAFLTTLEESDI